jgi:hypothetical protein
MLFVQKEIVFKRAYAAGKEKLPRNRLIEQWDCLKEYILDLGIEIAFEEYLFQFNLNTEEGLFFFSFFFNNLM